jgi:hypothetical protein
MIENLARQIFHVFIVVGGMASMAVILFLVFVVLLT